MKVKIFVIIVLLFLIHLSNISSQAPVKYNLKQGQVFHYAIESQYPNSGPAHTSFGLYFNFQVLAVDKSSYRIQLLFDKVYMSDENAYYDSQSGLPPFGNIPQYYGYLVGKPVAFSMSKDGTEFKVEGIGPLVDSIAKAYYKTNFSEKTRIWHFLRNDMINPAIYLVFAQEKGNTKEKTFNKLFKTSKNSYVDNDSSSWKQKVSHASMIINQSSFSIMRINLGQKNYGQSFVIDAYIDERSNSWDHVSGLPVNVQIINGVSRYEKIGMLSDFEDSIQINIRQLKNFEVSKKVTIYGKIRSVPSAIKISLASIGQFDFNPDNNTFVVDTFTNHEGSFSFTRELTRPVEIMFSFSSERNYLIYIQPGDSICVDVDFNNWDHTFVLNGKGAEVNNLLCDLGKYSRSAVVDWEKNLNAENSEDDFNRKYNYSPDIIRYYHAVKSLDSISKLGNITLSRYVKTIINWPHLENKYTYATKSINGLNWKINNKIKSDNYFNEIDSIGYTVTSNLFRNSLINEMRTLLSVDQNDPPQKLYYYAKYSLPNNELRYYVMANCVFILFKQLKVNEAKELLVDFEKTYPKSEYAVSLQKIISQKVDLSPGSIAPDFTLKDIDGRNVSLSDLKDKWVLLFVNNDDLDYTLEQEVKVAKEVKAKVLADKFEVIWVMTGEKKASIDKVIKDCSQLGTVLLNPGWKDKLFNNYKDEFTFQMHIISPGSRIEGNMGISLDEELSNQLIDSINNDETKKESSFVSIKTLLWILVIIIFVFVIVFAIYRRRMAMLSLREARQREKLDLELKAIRSQLNPHFMFNSLSSIQHLVNDNRVDDANHYLSSFAGLMRKVLHNSDKELVPLENELDTILQYLELEALRFNFKFKIDVAPNIDIFNTEIPPMLLQPFVENAVIHGIAAMNGNGEILVNVAKNEKQIRIVIEDNGTGISMSKVEDGNSGNGKGLSLTRKRMDLISQGFSNNMKFDITDLTNEGKQGTRVEISFESE